MDQRSCPNQSKTLDSEVQSGMYPDGLLQKMQPLHSRPLPASCETLIEQACFHGIARLYFQFELEHVSASPLNEPERLCDLQ